MQGTVSNVQLDLASLASIDTCVKAVLQQKRSIDYLICNAGVAYCPQQTTADGFEMQMGAPLPSCSMCNMTDTMTTVHGVKLDALQPCMCSEH